MELEAPAGGPAPPVAAAAAAAAWAWVFPVYVGHRRRLHPGDELYDDAPYCHDDRGRAAAVSAARGAPAAGAAAGAALRRDWAALAPRHECCTCHAVLPTAHLLDLHVAEVHDSFFAAQAARRLPVFVCLVESCDRRFGTVEQRKQHLVDHHKFPRGGNLDRIHLRRKKAQVRPLPEYRKGGGRGRGGGQGPDAAAAAAAGPAAPGGEPAPPETDAMAVDDALAAGMSRLSMAAQLSAVPRSVAFGRRRGGRAMPGLGRGRGSGGRGGEGGGAGAAAGEGGGGQGQMEQG